MIREPTVGMRVKSVAGGMHEDSFGKITRVEANGHWVWVELEGVSGDNLWPYEYQMITEIKESDMKCEDCRFWDKDAEQKIYMHEACNDITISRCTNEFDNGGWSHPKETIHKKKCAYYEPKVKELTVADIEKMVGGPWKIVKE